MCGICGIVSREPGFRIGDALKSMRESLVHRGPDDAGFYINHRVALGSRRLSILDLSARGHMPMSTPDGRFTIVYNGEVYNHRDFKPELENRGYEFRSHSDTEVLLYLYAEYGPAMLERLNGMFAIAIWDEKERTLFLSRDRLGVKPLYYAEQGSAFYFGSEEKALFAAGVRKNFDSDTWEELLCFRYVAGERTPYVGVKRLLPGHYLLWTNAGVQIKRWWNLSERARVSQPIPNPVQWFKQTFDDAVRIRRIADVPVGVLLSGGLDSGSVAASLGQHGSGLASFTVRFPEASYDEGQLAREVANRWKLASHELVVSPDQLVERLHAASRLNDEPLVHGSDLHLGAIAEYAKPRVTVLLSGEGGDETLGGYQRYRPLRYPGLLNIARPFLPRTISKLGLKGRASKLGNFLKLGSVDRFVLFNACDVLPSDLGAVGFEPSFSFPYRQRVAAEAQALYTNEPFRQAQYSDQQVFLCSVLDRTDRMTMGASIECRLPFLDYRLVEGLASLPTSSLLAGAGNKPLLRRAVGDRLPKAVLRHRKWGFAVPWNVYLRKVPELRGMVELLPEIEPVSEGPFDRKLMRNTVARFLNGDDAVGALVRQFLMIAIWYQACFAQLTPVARWESREEQLAVAG